MHERLIAAAAAVLLASCTVGPRHRVPDVPLPEQFDQAPAEATAQPVATRLWSSFGSRELDLLVARALEANTTIAQALARLDETRALSGLSLYSNFPTVTAAAGRERAKISGGEPFAPPGGLISDVYRAGFDASWEIDLFGGLRSENRAIRRRVEADEASLYATRLSIVAETAQAWFALVGARERLELRRRQLANLQDNLGILRAREEVGGASGLELAQAEAQMRAIAASVPQAEADVVREEQRLAVLTAWPVATLRGKLSPATGLPAMPQIVATGTPEEWLRRRPDIRAAERELAAVTADVGDEIAEFFPHVQLIGSFGWTAPERRDIGDDAAERWAYGPSITWSFLNAGRVWQNVKAAQARRRGAIAAYQETVLRALEETENALARFRASNRSEDELRAGAAAAAEAARLARLRYEVGAADYLAVLDAERTQIELEDQHVQAATARATALAALYKALAGDF